MDSLKQKGKKGKPIGRYLGRAVEAEDVTQRVSAIKTLVECQNRKTIRKV